MKVYWKRGHGNYYFEIYSNEYLILSKYKTPWKGNKRKSLGNLDNNLLRSFFLRSGSAVSGKVASFKDRKWHFIEIDKNIFLEWLDEKINEELTKPALCYVDRLLDIKRRLL